MACFPFALLGFVTKISETRVTKEVENSTSPIYSVLLGFNIGIDVKALHYVLRLIGSPHCSEWTGPIRLIEVRALDFDCSFS